MTFEGLKQGIVTLQYQQDDTETYLEELKLLQHRGKRALLPTVGKALNMLFGTVTEADLKSIVRKIIALGEGQKVLKREARKSLASNRQAIN